jgi:vitamin B12 transporter
MRRAPVHLIIVWVAVVASLLFALGNQARADGSAITANGANTSSGGPPKRGKRPDRIRPSTPDPHRSDASNTNASAKKIKKGPDSPENSAASHNVNKLPRMMIVVTAARMPQPLNQVGTTTSVMSGKQIQAQQIQFVPDALSEVPGVTVTQSGSPGTVADVSIRGSTPAQTLIMIDGVPVNNPTTDSFDVSRLTTDDLGSIEVVRGAGGALYGSQAIGGVVNMITKEGSGAPKFSLLSAGGNDSTERQAASLDGTSGRLAYSGALSYFSTDGFRPINDNSDNLSGALRLDYHLEPDTTLRGFARYTRANASLSSFSIAAGIPLNPNAHQRNEFMLYKGEIDHHFGEHLLSQLSAYYVRDDLRVNAYPFPGNLVSENDHIPAETRGANLDNIYTWTRNFRTLAGFDFQDLWAHSGSSMFFFSPTPPRITQFLSVYNARRQQYAGYVEQVGQFFEGRLIATGGFRVDGNSDFGEEVSPAWSVAIPIAKWGLTLRGNYAEGFRAPSFDELFFPGFGNPNLRPEVSSEYDGGFTKQLGEGLSFTATYFSRRVHSLIVTVPCAFNPVSCPFGSMAGNAGRVDTQGIELVPSFHPMRGLTMSGSLTILDQTHRSVTPTARPTRVPKYSASSVVDYKYSELFRNNDSLETTAVYTFVGDRDDITPQGTIANHDAWHRVDLTMTYSAGYRWRAVNDEQVFARIRNLLDRHYSEAFGFPAPPINVLAGVKLIF